MTKSFESLGELDIKQHETEIHFHVLPYAVRGRVAQADDRRVRSEGLLLCDAVCTILQCGHSDSRTLSGQPISSMPRCHATTIAISSSVACNHKNWATHLGQNAWAA